MPTAAIETEDNVSKSIPNDTVRKPAQEFLQTQLGTGTNSACPEKEDHSSTSKNENRKVKETRPNVSILEGPSSPRVEDKDPLPSANILAERFEAIAAIDLSFPSAKSFADPAVSTEIIDLNFLLAIIF